jgi:glutamyl-tRNA reductase
MSGPTVSQALHDRFEAIRLAEIARLRKKLGGLTESDRRFVEAITADVIHAIARVPEQALAKGASSTIETVVRLFALET